MVIELKVSVIGLTQAIAELTTFSKKISDWVDLWDAIEDFLSARVEQSFETEGAASGAGRWKPLAPKWARQKAILHPGQGILVATGQMKASLTDEGHPLALRRRRGKRHFVFGSRDPKVKIHQEGRGFWLDPRPMLVLTPKDVKALEKEAAGYVVRQMAASGMMLTAADMIHTRVGRGARVTPLSGGTPGRRTPPTTTTRPTFTP